MNFPHFFFKHSTAFWMCMFFCVCCSPPETVRAQHCCACCDIITNILYVQSSINPSPHPPSLSLSLLSSTSLYFSGTLLHGAVLSTRWQLVTL